MGRKVLEYQDLLTVAVEAAQRAGDFIRETERPSDPAFWTRKGFNDFVTDVDTTAERLGTAHLKERVPESQVRGEELSPDDNTDDLVWLVDPLDGTTNYLHGYPAYAVSIAAVYHGVLCVGVVLDVTRRLTYTAVKDGGAWSEGTRLHVSSI